ncbi:ABC transporter permease [Devosia sp. YIM 151766]|uniref:ABC transporter permease n=1 Tax=Devosia sp. YIM 151766 TaxID=3017325 RepID=UPI00255C69D2|nr:ABC transporter permease [Devosia sp. YIM 151766]WIY52979.1 ABC transporter permease [Devosia sp. YIM 151766]
MTQTSGTISALPAKTNIFALLRSPVFTQNMLLIAIVLVMLGFSLASGAFLTGGNIRNIALQSSIIMIVAIPSALLIISGYVDLSVGSILAVSGVCAGLASMSFGMPVGVLCGIAAGAAAGAVNGYVIAIRGFSPVIVTLGMLTLLRGLAMVIAASPIYGFPEAMSQLGRGTLFGVPYLVLIALAVALAGGFVTAFSPLGRHIFAIGVNARAAFLLGIRVRSTVFLLYVLTGAAAGLGGALQAARLDSAPAESLGSGFELTVLTAILLGGVSFSGGRGRIFGVVLGIWFLGVLQNGLTLLNVPISWTSVVTGVALVTAAGLDHLSQRGARR